MRPVLLAIFLGLAASLHAAAAQPAPAAPAKTVDGLPVESVTVIATKPSQAAIKSFVETRAARTYVLDRLASWHAKICPVTLGLGGKYARYISQRIRAVAAAVGAPLNSDPGCRPNIEVMFTTTPQALMDNVREQHPLFLGYHHTISEARSLATVVHPIQAWYTTESLSEFDTVRSVDDGRCGNSGVTMNTMGDGGAGVVQLSLPCAVVVHANGFRDRDGLSSGFFNILIVAEPAKLLNYEIGPLADYITMLALSQPSSQDSCQEMPSIANMLAKECATIPDRITDGDLAYLHALYRIYPGEMQAAQRNYIRDEMYRTLVSDKGG
jgi:hypothetical protein